MMATRSRTRFLSSRAAVLAPSELLRQFKPAATSSSHSFASVRARRARKRRHQFLLGPGFETRSSENGDGDAARNRRCHSYGEGARSPIGVCRKTKICDSLWTSMPFVMDIFPAISDHGDMENRRVMQRKSFLFAFGF